MDRLPQELVNEIAEHFFEPHRYIPCKRLLPALATLSRPWQHAIERFTFKSIRIRPRDLEEFCKLFASHTTRRRFLQDLWLEIILPSFSDWDSADYETADDRAAKIRFFNRHVSALLKELSQWPAGGKLKLEIDACLFMDFDHRDADELKDDYDEAAVGEREDPSGERHSHPYLGLSGALPLVVPRVTSFRAGLGLRTLDQGSAVAMTAAFPNLDSIIWSFEDPVYFLALRRQRMRDLASAVASFQPPALCKTLTMDIFSSWYPHKERLPNLMSGDKSFCSSLCAMLAKGNLQRFDYDGYIDPTLFWPQQALETDANLSWTSLQELEVRFHPGSLEGQWFFKGLPGDPLYDADSDIPLAQDAEAFLPPGYYDNDEQNDEAAAHAMEMLMPTDLEGLTEGCEFRCIPRDDAILPLLVAVARRLTHTPSLRKVYLESFLPLEKGAWFFSYHAPGQMSHWDEYVDCEGWGCDDPLLRARVFLHAEDWRPDEEVVALLRGIGKACHGKDTIVTFLPFLY